jgi:hypothetical protein
MMKAHSTTCAPIFSTSATVAPAVPPVASKSSITTTRAPLAQRIGMHFERVLPVLERVRDGVLLPRELAGLAHERNAHAQRVSDRCSHDEAPRFDPDHRVDFPAVAAREAVDDPLERLRVGEHGGNVAIDDSRLGKVGNVAYETLDVHRAAATVVACGR